MKQTHPPFVAYAQPKRLECLDSIRGLAALAVLLGHAMAAFAWPNYLVSWCRLPILNMMFDGRSAVTMFFVISGFVLTHPYLAPAEPGKKPRTFYIPTFYLRRFTRIWLPWFAAFILSALAQKYVFDFPPTIPPPSEWLGQFWHVSLSASNVLRQCVFWLHDAGRLLLPQDWSLGVELRGSLLIPLFVFLLRRNISALAGVVVLLLIFQPTGQYYFSFALGVWLARYYHQQGTSLRSLGGCAKGLLLVGGILLYESRLVAGRYWPGVADKIIWCLASLGCVLLLLASLSSRRIQAKLILPPVLFLGRISFSLYLLQFIVILCLLPPLVHQLNAAGIHSLLLLMPFTIITAVLATVTLAAVMYRVIEMPAMDLGHWLTKLIQRRLAKTPVKVSDSGTNEVKIN